MAVERNPHANFRACFKWRELTRAQRAPRSFTVFGHARPFTTIAD